MTGVMVGDNDFVYPEVGCCLSLVSYGEVITMYSLFYTSLLQLDSTGLRFLSLYIEVYFCHYGSLLWTAFSTF